jgi:iturin family lipopeptide synthetase A
VLREGDDGFVFLFVVHHIIADGWSINVILDEIAALYKAACEGMELTLAPPVSFSQYLAWIDDNYRSALNQDARNYWLKQLSRKIKPASLPVFALKDAGGTFVGNSYVLKLDDLTAYRLMEAARKEGCTVFMLLLALFNVFLSKIFGNNDQVIGIPSAGQLNMEAGSLVGCCIQLLPFFVEIDEEKTFADFLGKMKTDWLQAYRYRNFPYLFLARDENLNVPEINITFNMDAPAATITEDPVDPRGNLYQKSADFNKYNLFLNVARINKHYKLTFQYNNALFDDELMAGWVKGFEIMVDGILADRSIRISDISLNNNPEQPINNNILSNIDHEYLNTQGEYN